MGVFHPTYIEGGVPMGFSCCFHGFPIATRYLADLAESGRPMVAAQTFEAPRKNVFGRPRGGVKQMDMLMASGNQYVYNHIYI